ncbi:MAG TPA: hypothetical protein VGS22_01990 [Thermoanaerobaculia bacterium]|nr:hypothetical protein [Thermoanaerobaculia bacterium]
MHDKKKIRRAWLPALMLLGLGLLPGAPRPARATSLDGAGRIVIVPYAVSGMERESTIYLTNLGSLNIRIFGTYVGADGTPMAASSVGVRICGSVSLRAGEARPILLSQFCPLGTPDVENFGYLELSVFGGFDSNPFFATSVVTTRKDERFAVEGVPVGALDPGATSPFRRSTLRVLGLEGMIPNPPTGLVEKVPHCYLGARGEDKDVSVQLMDYTTGSARALGNPMTVRLRRWTMVKLANLLALANLPPQSYSNVTAELYALPPTEGADLVAGCSVETLSTRTEDFRIATTPQPNDRSRSRSPVRGDTRLLVGPARVGILMNQGMKVRLAFYMRHEDRARCWIVPSLVAPQENPAPWQELRVLDPDGAVVAGGSGISDTGTFFSGVKNQVSQGVNGRWVVEVSWRGTPATGYPNSGLTQGAFGVLCESTSGISAMLPLTPATDDF